MIARTVKSLNGPEKASVSCDKYYYRTEIENNHDFPIKIIWFDFYFLNMENGLWCANNIKNRPLREDDFLKWYSEGEDDPKFKDGWLLPNEVTFCDPNWNFGCEENFTPAKWSFIAVNDKGETFFSEAEMTKESVSFYKETTE